MLGLSSVLHGLILFNTSGTVLQTPYPIPEKQFVSTVRITRRGTTHQKNMPNKEQHDKIVEKPVEPLPVQTVENIENIPKENSENNEELHEHTDKTAERGTADIGEDGPKSEEPRDNTDGTGDIGTITSNEHEEVLAYIKEFINKNLAYPAMARQRNIEGIVGIAFEIEMDGGIVSIKVAHSSGSSILDNAAVSLIKKIRPLENTVIKRKLALNVNIDYKLTE